jgi:recombination protein RecR
MSISSESIEKAINYFSSLPSIGKKTAQRLVFHLLKEDEEYIEQFSNSLINLKKNVKFCSSCFNYTESDPCLICESKKRNRKTICVVEQPSDVAIIEKTNEYFGLYHVLHGILNPMEGISPEDLKVKELISRLIDIEEVILALNPTVEGEVTSQYIGKLVNSLDIKVSRIASGVPIGSSLEFTDVSTLSKAIESRISI